jgi:hypothetical protein
VVLPSSLVSAPQQVPLCIWGLHPDSPGGQIPLWIKLSVGIWWDLLLVVWGMYLGDKRGDKSLSPQSWQWTPMKCWGNLKVRYGHWGRLAGSNISLCWHRLNRLVSKGWAPRTKRSPLICLCKQVTEAKSKAQFTYGCMWLYWLFYSRSVMWPSLCFSSLSFISLLCHPFPPPHYQNSASVFLFWPSSLLHHSTLWCSDPPRAKSKILI